MTTDRHPPTEAGDRESLVAIPALPTGDETGEASFPASDPPATWTWDVPETPRAARPG